MCTTIGNQEQHFVKGTTSCDLIYILEIQSNETRTVFPIVNNRNYITYCPEGNTSVLNLKGFIFV